ncbi:MAG: hypothetical protein M1819_003644 [Sarea resinae]|nr:MAG: hypothetical protein M1819_003644 [Sarea resinae]
MVLSSSELASIATARHHHPTESPGGPPTRLLLDRVEIPPLRSRGHGITSEHSRLKPPLPFANTVAKQSRGTTRKPEYTPRTESIPIRFTGADADSASDDGPSRVTILSRRTLEGGRVVYSIRTEQASGVFHREVGPEDVLNHISARQLRDYENEQFAIEDAKRLGKGRRKCTKAPGAPPMLAVNGDGGGGHGEQARIRLGRPPKRRRLVDAMTVDGKLSRVLDEVEDGSSLSWSSRSPTSLANGHLSSNSSRTALNSNFGYGLREMPPRSASFVSTSTSPRRPRSDDPEELAPSVKPSNIFNPHDTPQQRRRRRFSDSLKAQISSTPSIVDATTTTSRKTETPPPYRKRRRKPSSALFSPRKHHQVQRTPHIPLAKPSPARLPQIIPDSDQEDSDEEEEKVHDEEESDDDENEKEKGEYQIEAILDDRMVALSKGRHEHHYLIKWTGYPSSENTWEPVSNLERVQDMIRRYHEAQNEKRHRATEQVKYREPARNRWM